MRKARTKREAMTAAMRAAKYLIRHPHSLKTWEILAENTEPQERGNRTKIRCPFPCDGCPLHDGVDNLMIPFFCDDKTHNHFEQYHGSIVVALIQFVAKVEAWLG